MEDHPPTYVITKHVDGGWNIIDHSGDPPTLQGGDRLVPESYAIDDALNALRTRAEKAEESAIRWRSRADRLEATRNEAIRQAEARATQLEEAAANVLEAIGWGGTLKFGYQGGSGEIEEFEESLHELSRLLPREPDAKGPRGGQAMNEATCPSCGQTVPISAEGYVQHHRVAGTRMTCPGIGRPLPRGTERKGRNPE